MKPLETLRAETRRKMIELMDDPRTGLRESSDTNKTRMAMLGLIDEILDSSSYQAGVEAERERTADKMCVNPNAGVDNEPCPCPRHDDLYQLSNPSSDV